jgi:hypothetical protein
MTRLSCFDSYTFCGSRREAAQQMSGTAGEQKRCVGHLRLSLPLGNQQKT